MATKRANGEGSIRLRKDGRWEGRFTAGSDAETGKTITKSVMGKSKEDAEEKLRLAISAYKREQNALRGNLTTGEWIKIWFETYSKPLIRPATQASYGSIIKHHLYPRIGDIPLNELTARDIQQMYNELKISGRVRINRSTTDLGVSNRMIHSIHMLLRQCLKGAVNEDKILFNPADRCKLPPKNKPEMKIIPPESIGKYLKAADDISFLPMFYLELSVGLRRGELVALLWEDLDIQNKTISVSKQITCGKYVSTPKTPNSTRVVPIPQRAVQLLKEEHSKHPDNPYMFPSPVTGSMYYPDSVSRIHKKILRRAGLEIVRFHDLRHTFAALALQNGVDIKTLSHILGHYSAGFTLDTYGHVTEKMRRDAAKKISKFMNDIMGE